MEGTLPAGPGKGPAGQLVEKARLRRPFPPKPVSPAPAARLGKSCYARLLNPAHMSVGCLLQIKLSFGKGTGDSEYGLEDCCPRTSQKGFGQAEKFAKGLKIITKRTNFGYRLIEKDNAVW